MKSEKKQTNEKLMGNYTGKVTNIADRQTEIDLEKTVKMNQTLYSRRLQKSKIKDLERELRTTDRNKDQKRIDRLQDELKRAK